MELTDDQIAQTASILHHVVTDDKVKLAWGRMRRQQDKEVVKSGQDPKGYRADFLRSSIRAVNDTLMKCAEDFNKANPHDRVSVRDFLDILGNIYNRYKAG